MSPSSSQHITVHYLLRPVVPEPGIGVRNTLTLILSVAAITLTQMVLNQPKRHDAALHLKIDELIHAMKGARDEIAGIENKSEAELEALRETGDVAERVLQERRDQADR